MHQLTVLPRGFEHSVAIHAHALVRKHVGKRLDFPRFIPLHHHAHEPRAEIPAVPLPPLEFRDEVDVSRGYPLFLRGSRVDGADDAEVEASCDGVCGFSVGIGGEEFDFAVAEALFGDVKRVNEGDFADAVGAFEALVAAVEVGEVLDLLAVVQPVLDEAVQALLVDHLDIIDMAVFLGERGRKIALDGQECTVSAGRRCRDREGREDDCDRTFLLCRTEASAWCNADSAGLDHVGIISSLGLGSLRRIDASHCCDPLY